MNLNTTRWAEIAVLGAVFSFGCGSTKSNGVMSGDAGSAGDTAVGAGGDATGGGGEPASDAGTGNTGDSGAPGLGDAGASSTGVARGSIDLTQADVDGTFNYDVGGGFARFGASHAAADGIVCTASTIGPCLVEACTIADNAGASTTPNATVLNAGTITVTGAGDSQALLTFGVVSPQSTQKGYASVHADTQFFSGGDSITVQGAGGPDLPAFTAHALIAPNEVVITAPTCPDLICPEVDRTQDLAVTWTGGAAGQVRASFETISPNSTGTVFCTFDAASGAGTVPKAALAVLGDISDGVTTGLQIFQSMNTVEFNVGDVPTTFTIQSANVEALWSTAP
jgi:hypothetical protein